MPTISFTCHIPTVCSVRWPRYTTWWWYIYHICCYSVRCYSRCRTIYFCSIPRYTFVILGIDHIHYCHFTWCDAVVILLTILFVCSDTNTFPYSTIRYLHSTTFVWPIYRFCCISFRSTDVLRVLHSTEHTLPVFCWYHSFCSIPFSHSHDDAIHSCDTLLIHSTMMHSTGWFTTITFCSDSTTFPFYIHCSIHRPLHFHISFYICSITINFRCIPFRYITIVPGGVWPFDVVDLIITILPPLLFIRYSDLCSTFYCSWYGDTFCSPHFLPVHSTVLDTIPILQTWWCSVFLLPFLLLFVRYWCTDDALLLPVFVHHDSGTFDTIPLHIRSYRYDAYRCIYHSLFTTFWILTFTFIPHVDLILLITTLSLMPFQVQVPYRYHHLESTTILPRTVLLFLPTDYRTGDTITTPFWNLTRYCRSVLCRSPLPWGSDHGRYLRPLIHSTDTILPFRYFWYGDATYCSHYHRCCSVAAIPTILGTISVLICSVCCSVTTVTLMHLPLTHTPRYLPVVVLFIHHWLFCSFLHVTFVHSAILMFVVHSILRRCSCGVVYSSFWYVDTFILFGDTISLWFYLVFITLFYHFLVPTPHSIHYRCSFDDDYNYDYHHSFHSLIHCWYDGYDDDYGVRLIPYHSCWWYRYLHCWYLFWWPFYIYFWYRLPFHHSPFVLRFYVTIPDSYRSIVLFVHSHIPFDATTIRYSSIVPDDTVPTYIPVLRCICS